MTVQAQTTPLVRKPEIKPVLMTGEELFALGDTGRSELIEGRLVRMSPTKPQHGWMEIELGQRLHRFVKEHHLGRVMAGEVGVYIHRNPDTIRAADLLYISHERLAAATPDSFLDVPPELIVEIISESDRWGEMRRKLREYFEIGVNVVLILDPEENTASVYRSLTDVQELTPGDALTLEDILPGFRAPLAEIFA